MQVLRRFRVVFNAVRSHFRDVEKAVGLGGAQVWALGLVVQQPGMGVNDLASAMDIHQSTASNLVKALVERGLLTVARSDADRRSVQLHATSKARPLLRRAPQPLAGVLPQALASLDATTLARLDADLGRVERALSTGRRAAKTPLAEL